MIPSVIAADTPSPGERDLFKRLRDDPGTADWVVLHSFNLPRHVTQISGEADFIILAPGLGLLCVEVKAHRRAARDSEGRWVLGSNPPTSKSPFKQAEDNMHSLLSVLRERRRAEADALIAWWAVVFTHAEFREPAVEWNDWEVLDSRDLRRAPISVLVTRVLEQARKRLPHKAFPGGPTAQECAVVAAALRPRFEVVQATAQRRADAAEEVRMFTEEQYAAIDGMARNPRVVFEGPAGTGKTLLALETARRAAATGAKVGLVCFNHLLGSWLSVEASQMPGDVTAGTLHQLLLAAAGTTAPAGASAAFFQDELPDLAAAAILDSGQPAEYDVLVIDEAQDLLRDPYLDFLDLSLDGGLASGRWTMWGDFERQALYGAANLSLDGFRATRGDVPVYSLRTNCRNTPRVARWISMLSVLVPGYSRIRRPDAGPAPRTKYFDSDHDQADLLGALLAELYKSGIEGQDIVVLSPKRDGAAMRLGAPWKDRLKPYGHDTGGKYIRHATVHAFKGLEAPIVVLTDVTEVHGDRARSLFYTATTRATEQLHVLADVALRDEILDLIDRYGSESTDA